MMIPTKYKNPNKTHYDVPHGDPYLCKLRGHAQYLVNYREWIGDVWLYFINDERFNFSNWWAVESNMYKAMQMTQIHSIKSMNLPDLRDNYFEAYQFVLWMGNVLCKTVGFERMFPFGSRAPYAQSAMDEKIPYRKNLQLMFRLVSQYADAEEQGNNQSDYNDQGDYSDQNDYYSDQNNDYSNQSDYSDQNNDYSDQNNDYNDYNDYNDQNNDYSDQDNGYNDYSDQNNDYNDQNNDYNDYSDQSDYYSDQDNGYNDYNNEYNDYNDQNNGYNDYYSDQDNSQYSDTNSIYENLQFRLRKRGSYKETFTTYIWKMADRLDALYPEVDNERNNVFVDKLIDGLANYPETQKLIEDVADNLPMFYSTVEMVNHLIDIVQTS